MTGRNLDRSLESAGIIGPAGDDVSIFLPDAVAVDVAVLDEQGVPRSGHDALDEGLRRLLGGGLVTGLAVPRLSLRLVAAHPAVEVGAVGRVKEPDASDAAGR